MQNNNSRVFISYRRSDSPWFVGRLSDSLSEYFGEERIFRDVVDIEGGADFHHTIESALDTADALIAVIGPEWLTASGPDGKPVLGTPDDWVGLEIGIALQREIPVYPVLVGNTPMPRIDELPDELKSLTRWNAVSIVDDRWDADVKRLARIIQLDIPSPNERILTRANVATTIALVASVWLTVGFVAYRYLAGHTWFGTDTACRGVNASFTLIEKWQTGFIYFALVCCVVAFFVLARHVDEGKRWIFRSSAWFGAAGAAVAFAIYLPVCGNFESAIHLFLGVPIVTTVLGLMSLSGFKPK